MQDARRAASQAERHAVERSRCSGDLTPRGWDHSDRFDEAWALIAATFEVEVTVLANVIAFKPLSAPKKPRVKPSR
jgi:hypothetical protein